MIPEDFQMLIINTIIITYLSAIQNFTFNVREVDAKKGNKDMT